MKKAIITIFSVLLIVSTLAVNVSATMYRVDNAQLSIFAQSSTESTAHLISSSVGMYNNGPHPWCGNRAYILLSDKELFATALAASLSGKAVNFYYEDAAENKSAAGHIAFGCKVVSIWW